MDSKLLKPGYQEKIQKIVDETFSTLENIWTYIGLPSSDQKHRSKYLCENIQKQCEHIIRDEKEAKQRVINKLQRCRGEMELICSELKMEPPKPIVEGSILERCDREEEVLIGLQRKKEERMKEVRNYHMQLYKLCVTLGEEYSEPENLTVYSQKEMDTIRRKIESLQMLKAVRKAEYCRLKKSILQMVLTLEESTSEQVTMSLEDSESEEEMCLTESHLKSLQSKTSDLEFQIDEVRIRHEELREELLNVWNLLDIEELEREEVLTRTAVPCPSALQELESQLKVMKALRFQNLPMIVSKLRKQLDILWPQCWLLDEEKGQVPCYHDVPPTEVSVLELEKAVLSKKKYLQTHGEVFSLAAKYDSLFSELLSLEAKAKDPKRLFNTRGGTLLKEEKQRKKVKQDLPRVQEKLLNLFEDYEEVHKCTAPSLFGLTIEEHIEEKWNSHDMAREMEKKSKPSTAKARTPMKTIRNTENVIATPAACRKRENVSNERCSYEENSDSNSSTGAKRAFVPPEGGSSSQDVPHFPVPRKRLHAPSKLLDSKQQTSGSNSLQDITSLDYNNFEHQLRASRDRLNSTTTLEERNKENTY